LTDTHYTAVRRSNHNLKNQQQQKLKHRQMYQGIGNQRNHSSKQNSWNGTYVASATLFILWSLERWPFTAWQNIAPTQTTQVLIALFFDMVIDHGTKRRTA